MKYRNLHSYINNNIILLLQLKKQYYYQYIDYSCFIYQYTT